MMQNFYNIEAWIFLFYFRFTSNDNKFSFSLRHICGQQVSSMSIVNVYVTTKYVSNTKTKLAMTLVDRIANLGETETLSQSECILCYLAQGASWVSSPA